MVDEQQAPAGAEAGKGQFAIQRIYVKDFSFETPGTPEIFQDDWKPDMNMEMQTGAKEVSENVHEVVLTLTVTVKSNDKVAFIAEIKQAGIFSIIDFPKDQLEHALGSFCPSILYPYARATMTNMVSQGSFPQLVLAPINFDGLYMQHLQKKAQEKNENGEAA